MSLQPPRKNPGRTFRNVLILLVALIGTPLILRALAPQWWQERGVVWSSAAPADFAAANHGQLKNLALAAYEDFRANIPAALGGIGDMRAPVAGVIGDKGGTGFQIRALIEHWAQLDASGAVVRDGVTGRIVSQPDPAKRIGDAEDFSAVRQGEAKASAKLFFDRLRELDTTWDYPWTAGVGDDKSYSMCNLGQLKSLFSFDARRDRDNDGMSDITELHWQTLHPGSPWTFSPTNPDMDGDGLLDGEEVADSTDPFDYYNGAAPVLAITATVDKGLRNTVLAAPLFIEARKAPAAGQTQGELLANAPVSVSISSLQNGITTETAGIATSAAPTSWITGPLTLRTDATGRAAVWVKLPDVVGKKATLTASAISPAPTAAAIATRDVSSFPKLLPPMLDGKSFTMLSRTNAVPVTVVVPGGTPDGVITATLGWTGTPTNRVYVETTDVTPPPLSALGGAVIRYYADDVEDPIPVPPSSSDPFVYPGGRIIAGFDRYYVYAQARCAGCEPSGTSTDANLAYYLRNHGRLFQFPSQSAPPTDGLIGWYGSDIIPDASRIHNQPWGPNGYRPDGVVVTHYSTSNSEYTTSLAWHNRVAAGTPDRLGNLEGMIDRAPGVWSPGFPQERDHFGAATIDREPGLYLRTLMPASAITTAGYSVFIVASGEYHQYGSVSMSAPGSLNRLFVKPDSIGASNLSPAAWAATGGWLTPEPYDWKPLTPGETPSATETKYAPPELTPVLYEMHSGVAAPGGTTFAVTNTGRNGLLEGSFHTQQFGGVSFPDYLTLGRRHQEGGVSTGRATYYYVLIYNHVLNDTDRQKVLRYLFNKAPYPAPGIPGEPSYAANGGQFLPDMDSDHDGLPDWREIELGTRWQQVDANNDGIGDFTPAQLHDTDGDGLSDFAEGQVFMTNPKNWDSDGDWIPDYMEITIPGLNPFVDDANGNLDGDGLTNFQEVSFFADPLDPDSDGDGYSDGIEVANLAIPTNANDTPRTIPPPPGSPEGTPSTLAPPEDQCTIAYPFGDSSSSHSEIWALDIWVKDGSEWKILQRLQHTTYHLAVMNCDLHRLGREYKVTIYHIGTDSTKDVDYDAEVKEPQLTACAAGTPLPLLIVDNDGQLIGTHGTSGPTQSDPTDGLYCKLKPTKLDLRVDTNRDGMLDDKDEKDEDKITKASGAIFIANCDNDRNEVGSYDSAKVMPDGSYTLPDDRKQIENEDDVKDIAKLVIRGLGANFRQKYPDAKIKLKIGQIADLQGIRVFKRRVINEDPIWGASSGRETEQEIDITTYLKGGGDDETEFGIEALYFAGVTMHDGNIFDGEIELTVSGEGGSTDFGPPDTIRMNVAPWLLIPNEGSVVNTFIAEIKADDPRGIPNNGEFQKHWKKIVTHTWDPQAPIVLGGEIRTAFTQDHVEIGYTSLPGQELETMHATLLVPDNETLVSWPATKLELLGRNAGIFSLGRFKRFNPGIQPHAGNQGGNIELIPPTKDWPLGLVVVGNTATAQLGDFLDSQALGNKILQPKIVMDTNWLQVGHIDEIIGITSQKKNRLPVILAASPREAYKFLDDPNTAGHLLFFSSESNPIVLNVQSNSAQNPAKLIFTKGAENQNYDLSADKPKRWKYFRVFSGPGKGCVGRIINMESDSITIDRIWITGQNVLPDAISRLSGMHVMTVATLAEAGIAAGSRLVLCGDSKFYPSPNIPIPPMDLAPAVITAQEIREDENLRLQNIGTNSNGVLTAVEYFQKRINASQSALASNGCVTIEVPVIFGIGQGAPGAIAFTPNSANAQVADGLLLPHTYSPLRKGGSAFESVISNAWKSKGLSYAPRLIDDWIWYHCFGGEIHCATVIKRLPPNEGKWWNTK